MSDRDDMKFRSLFASHFSSQMRKFEIPDWRIIRGIDDSTDPALFESLYPHRLFGGTTLWSNLTDVEVVIALFLAYWMAGTVIVGGGVVIVSASVLGQPNWSGSTLATCALAWLALSVLELKSIGFVTRVRNSPDPRAIHLALSQRPEMAVRLLVASWWLLHAGAAILVGALFKLGTSHEPVPSDVPPWFKWAIDRGFLLGFAYASNLFIVLAAGAVFPRERFLQWVWRCRFLIDVLVVIYVPPLIRLYLTGR